MRAAISLYRTGPGGGPLPSDALWANAHLWAMADTAVDLTPGSATHVSLDPLYGPAAAMYWVEMIAQESIEQGWAAAIVGLTVNTHRKGDPWLPLSWYVGEPTDWPSGFARFPDIHGEPDLPRSVWTLVVRRSA